MLDHVRGHDDVEPAAAHEFRERLTPPDVVHIFDSRDVNLEVRRVFFTELVGVGVVDRLDAKAVPLRQDRVVARADLETQARSVEEATDLGLTAGRIGELIHGPERSRSSRHTATDAREADERHAVGDERARSTRSARPRRRARGFLRGRPAQPSGSSSSCWRRAACSGMHLGSHEASMSPSEIRS